MAWSRCSASSASTAAAVPAAATNRAMLEAVLEAERLATDGYTERARRPL